MTIMYRESQTAGKKAYETELLARPTYHDGTPRKAWDQLADHMKYSWEKNPTPRWSLPTNTGVSLERGKIK